MKLKKIHITGASGSGTTTLGKALAQKFGYTHLDTDTYYWLPTEPPFQQVREITERKELLNRDMTKQSQWISSGSMCGWVDFAIPYFELVIFLFIPPDIRIERIYKREEIRSPETFIEGTLRHKGFLEFIDWAKRYDTAGNEIRSLFRHNEMLQKLDCPVLRIEEVVTVEESIARALEYINAL